MSGTQTGRPLEKMVTQKMVAGENKLCQYDIAWPSLNLTLEGPVKAAYHSK